MDKQDWKTKLMWKMSGKCKPEEYRVAILVEYKIIFYAEA